MTFHDISQGAGHDGKGADGRRAAPGHDKT